MALSWLEALPSVPYPPARSDGYWAPITSTIIWCEEKYYATTYIAEIVNTLTNLLVVYLSLKGMYNCVKNGHARIFFLTFLGFLVVGLGSFAFHATLKYPMQLLDELSMIYTTCLMTWAVFEHGRPLALKVLLGASVTGLSIFITWYYHISQDPSFHETAYGILTAVVLLRSMFLMELHLRPYFRQRRREAATAGTSTAEQRRRDERDGVLLAQMWTLVAVGLTAFLGGFAIWNLDNAYCSRLRVWRHQIGLPWGLLLEGHGWWHLGTGIGAYIGVHKFLVPFV